MCVCVCVCVCVGGGGGGGGCSGVCMRVHVSLTRMWVVLPTRVRSEADIGGLSAALVEPGHVHSRATFDKAHEWRQRPEHRRQQQGLLPGSAAQLIEPLRPVLTDATRAWARTMRMFSRHPRTPNEPSLWLT